MASRVHLTWRTVPIAAALATLAACDAARPAADIDRGRLLLRQYGCGTCHHIPGVADARGNTGPPLTGIGRRAYIAGILPNTRENLARWIAAPQSIDPLTRMPDMQVPPAHLADIVAYLETLR